MFVKTSNELLLNQVLPRGLNLNEEAAPRTGCESSRYSLHCLCKGSQSLFSVIKESNRNDVKNELRPTTCTILETAHLRLATDLGLRMTLIYFLRDLIGSPHSTQPVDLMMVYYGCCLYSWTTCGVTFLTYSFQSILSVLPTPSEERKFASLK